MNARVDNSLAEANCQSPQHNIVFLRPPTLNPTPVQSRFPANDIEGLPLTHSLARSLLFCLNGRMTHAQDTNDLTPSCLCET